MYVKMTEYTKASYKLSADRIMKSPSGAKHNEKKFNRVYLKKNYVEKYKNKMDIY